MSTPVNTSEGQGAQDQFERSGAAIAANRPDLLANVSAAQQRVLAFLLAGLTEPQIAERIGRSRHTVHDHTKAIYSALKVNNRVQLVLLFSTPVMSAAVTPRAMPISNGVAYQNGYDIQSKAG